MNTAPIGGGTRKNWARTRETGSLPLLTMIATALANEPADRAVRPFVAVLVSAQVQADELSHGAAQQEVQHHGEREGDEHRAHHVQTGEHPDDGKTDERP